MEKIYPPESFSCTEQVENLKAYFDKFKDKGNPQVQRNSTIDSTFSEIYGKNIAPKELCRIAEACSIDKLSVPDEVEPININNINKHKVKYKWEFKQNDHFNLYTLQAQLDRGPKNTRKKDYDDTPLQIKHSPKIDFAPGEEILVTVRIYHPFTSSLYRQYASKLRPNELKFSQEIVALGSQTLAVLRDKISCINDKGCAVPVDDIEFVNPIPQSDKDTFPSGLICINDHLFIDMRHPNAIDYSVPIKKWAKERNVANLITKDMKNVRIDEISLRFGYPYLYQHRGDCEHIFVFSDARLANKTDSLCREDYPFRKNVSRFRTPYCNLCHSAPAKWICLEYERLPNDRTFLCNDCLKSYNYVDGEKIGDFTIYPYVNKSLAD